MSSLPCRKLLPIAAVALTALTLTTSLLPPRRRRAIRPISLRSRSSRSRRRRSRKADIDVGEPGLSLGDSNVITEDAYRDGKRVGTSDLTCTIMRLQFAPRFFFAGQCLNTTTLPGGQITAQGVATSDEIEKVPFQQVITGGTGIYKGSGGVLSPLTTAATGPAAPHVRAGALTYRRSGRLPVTCPTARRGPGHRLHRGTRAPSAGVRATPAAELVVVVRLLAERGEVDHAEAGVTRPAAQLAQLGARRLQHGEPGGNQTGMRPLVGVDEPGADERGLPRAEREREHGRGVGGQSRWQGLVDHDHTTFGHLRDNVADLRGSSNSSA